MQADTVAREAFCGHICCPSQAYATLACKQCSIHLAELIYWPLQAHLTHIELPGLDKASRICIKSFPAIACRWLAIQRLSLFQCILRCLKAGCRSENLLCSLQGRALCLAGIRRSA